MDIQTKLGYLRAQIASIATHDDAPETEIRAALKEVADLVSEADANLSANRAARTPVQPVTE